VALTSGNDYMVTQWSAAGDYYYRIPPASWLPTGVIEYKDMRYDNSVTATTFPAGTLNGYQYGVSDIGYELASISAVPEPSTVGLSLAGLALAALRMRRRHTRN
jgi:hypothetical protein